MRLIWIILTSLFLLIQTEILFTEEVIVVNIKFQEEGYLSISENLLYLIPISPSIDSRSNVFRPNLNEKFYIIDINGGDLLDNDYVKVKASDNLYLTYDSNSEIKNTAIFANEKEIWQIKKERKNGKIVNGDKVCFENSEGNYLYILNKEKIKKIYSRIRLKSSFWDKGGGKIIFNNEPSWFKIEIINERNNNYRELRNIPTDIAVLNAVELIKNKKNIGNADFKNINFSRVNLYGNDFTGSDLRGCMFIKANLSSVDFCDANLEGVNFKDAQLYNVNFTNAKLKGVDFKNAKIKKCNFSNADMRLSDMENINITESNFENTLMNDANLYNSTFYRGNNLINNIKINDNTILPKN